MPFPLLLVIECRLILGKWTYFGCCFIQPANTDNSQIRQLMECQLTE